jgi:hypothetical protein
VNSTRRTFLGAVAVSGATVFLNGPLALAAAAMPDADAGTAALVLNALALEPANPIAPADWASVAQTRFTRGRGDRAAFTRLRAESPDLTVLTPERLSRRLTELMFPDYRGPRTLTRADIDAELAAIDSEPRKALPDVPSVTGEFKETPRASAAVLAQLRQPATARQLRASQAVATALDAANELLGRDEVDSKAGLEVAL